MIKSAVDEYWLRHAERATTDMRLDLEEFFEACARWNLLGDDGVAEIAVEIENRLSLLEARLKRKREEVDQ